MTNDGFTLPAFPYILAAVTAAGGVWLLPSRIGAGGLVLNGTVRPTPEASQHVWSAGTVAGLVTVAAILTIGVVAVAYLANR